MVSLAQQAFAGQTFIVTKCRCHTLSQFYIVFIKAISSLYSIQNHHATVVEVIKIRVTQLLHLLAICLSGFQELFTNGRQARWRQSILQTTETLATTQSTKTMKWWQKVWASNIGQHPAEKIGGNALVPRNKGGSPEHEGWRSYNQKDSRMTIRCFVFSKIILYAQQSLSPSFHRFLKPLQRMFFWRKKMYSLPPPSATPPTHLLWKAFGVLNLNFNEQLSKLNSK